ncbi:MAG: BON domain-containing protein [Acidobacteria bacterium]|nr:BON domain-containing protein [Acidobacteriota bacterium]
MGRVRMGQPQRLLNALLLGAAALSAGCSGGDADRIARVSGKALDRATAMTENAGQRLGLALRGVKPGVDAIEVSARVSQRLKWDQVLEGTSITVHASERTITLTGTVTDEVQRRRAMDLAQSTLGVEQVQESLEVAAQTRRARW